MDRRTVSAAMSVPCVTEHSNLLKASLLIGLQRTLHARSARVTKALTRATQPQVVSEESRTTPSSSSKKLPLQLAPGPVSEGHSEPRNKSGTS